MPALGHSRRIDRSPIASGLIPTMDIIRPSRLVRFVPTGEVAKAPTLARPPADLAGDLPLLYRRGIKIIYRSGLREVFWPRVANDTSKSFRRWEPIVGRLWGSYRRRIRHENLSLVSHGRPLDHVEERPRTASYSKFPVEVAIVLGIYALFVGVGIVCLGAALINPVYRWRHLLRRD